MPWEISSLLWERERTELHILGCISSPSFLRVLSTHKFVLLAQDLRIWLPFGSSVDGNNLRKGESIEADQNKKKLRRAKYHRAGHFFSFAY